MSGVRVRVQYNMSRTLRPRSDIDYSSESQNESVFTVDSASQWKPATTKYMNIRVTDVQELFPKKDLPNEAKPLMIVEWTDGRWLRDVDIKTAPYNNQIKTLIRKVRKVFLSEEESITEVIVDGFMQSLLNILYFDDYPCSLYPQYDYAANIGPDNHKIKAKPDFSVFSDEDKIMLVIEDKTVTSATFSNNWKEDQVMGELFATVHFIVSKAKTELTYPITVYAVRVIGTKFTFYKAQAELEYIIESAMHGVSFNKEMVVQRCPRVELDPSKLTAYDICKFDDRMRILECLCSIRRWICE